MTRKQKGCSRSQVLSAPINAMLCCVSPASQLARLLCLCSALAARGMATSPRGTAWMTGSRSRPPCAGGPNAGRVQSGAPLPTPARNRETG